MAIHRTDHEAYSLFLAAKKLDELLAPCYEEPERSVVASESLHAIIGHRRRGDPITLEAGIVRVADALDMAEGRSRVPFESGRQNIHSLSAAAIEKVTIERGEERPVRIEITMNNSAGIFQVDELLATKLRGSGREEQIDVVARIDTSTRSGCFRSSGSSGRTRSSRSPPRPRSHSSASADSPIGRRSEPVSASLSLRAKSNCSSLVHRPKRDTGPAMSKRNVDVARRSWAAWSRGDIDEGLSCYSVDAEWDMSTFSGWPEQQLFRGHGKIREFLERWRGAWDDYEAGVDEFIDSGDKVCVLCWQRGRSKEAGVQVEMMKYAHVLTVRDGKITRAELHSDRQRALEAAGLSV